MEELTNLINYQQYKQAMDTELRRTTEGFVRIGYLLKVARDTDILKESGYSSVVEFAQKEYNIDKTQVSRFISINDRFSEGGYSDRLQEKYRDFGYAKLTIMLQLPNELNEVLSPEYSKAEIQALKEEVDEEKKITDIEVLLEGQDEAQAVLDNNMSKVLHQLFKENPEKFVEVHKALSYGLDEVLLALAPSGRMIYNVRLPGIGRIAFSVQEDNAEAELVNIRTGEMEKYPWAEVMETLRNMINTLLEPVSEWQRIYGEPFYKYPKGGPLQLNTPKNVEVAPVQPSARASEKPAEKPVSRKESKVVKSKPAEKKPKQEEKKPEPQLAAEEQLPGQMDITEFKEALPEPSESQENGITALHEANLEPEVISEEDIEVVETPETRILSLAEGRSPEEIRKEIARVKAGLTSTLRNMPRLMEQKKWDEMGKSAMDIKWRVDKIKELEEQQNGI